MKLFHYLLLGILFCMCSCSQNGQPSNAKPLDLLKYGAPITINAPDGAIVKKSKMGNWDDITIKKDDYSVQLFVRNSTSNDVKQAKNEELALVKDQKHFSSIIEDEEHGFIYETKIDSVVNYNFRYVHLIADRLYTFQKGLADNLTKEQAKMTYNSVKQ